MSSEEERKAWTLIDGGYNPALDGPAYSSIFFQNSNNSVRVQDDFMRAVEEDAEWSTREVTSGEPFQTYKARTLMKMIAGQVRSRSTRKYLSREHHRAADVDWVTGACVFVSRTAWDAVGGFDGVEVYATCHILAISGDEIPFARSGALPAVE